MERLSHMIQEEVDKGRWVGLKLVRNGLLITHLFFVDDMVLFTEASVEQLTIVKSCLDCFCMSSG